MVKGAHEFWSSLRGPITELTFAEMKEAASASTLPTVQLGHLHQGPRGTSKGTLMDAIDSLFDDLDKNDQDTAAVYMIEELISRRPNRKDRLEGLLRRRGWHLVEGVPAPLELLVSPPLRPLPDQAQAGYKKVIARYRDGDYAGAMTSAASMVDVVTKNIYDNEGLQNFSSSSFHNRTISAFRALKPRLYTELKGMTPNDVKDVLKAQERAVNGAAEVLAKYRNEYGDAHGSPTGQVSLVPLALSAALFLVTSLTPLK